MKIGVITPKVLTILRGAIKYLQRKRFHKKIFPAIDHMPDIRNMPANHQISASAKNSPPLTVNGKKFLIVRRFLLRIKRIENGLVKK